MARGNWKRKDPLERFLSFVEPVTESGCWIWTSGMRGAYGRFPLPGRGNGSTQAHCWAYEHFKGTIPDGYEIDHLCRVHCCVNPDHLEPVTHRVNVLRGVSKLAEQARRTHCPQGHLLSGPNLLMRNRGKSRSCRICYQEQVARGSRKYRAKKKAQRACSQV